MIKENNLKKLKKEISNVNRQFSGNISSLVCWARAIRLSNYSDIIMKEAFEKCVNPEDYHPNEKKRLLNFTKLKMIV